MNFVTYENFGAKGDGAADDIDAIAAAHAYANAHRLPVSAKAGAVYYISGRAVTAEIQTDVDFGTASFIIDDRTVENRNAPVFQVTSRLQPFVPQITALHKNQRTIDFSAETDCFVTVTDAHIKNYIRWGPNQNNGSSQMDCFIAGKNGEVKNPIVWEFPTITDALARPIDADTLTIRGGTFTTIANQEESFYRYYARGIAVTRSNTVVEGITHRIEGEGESGAPYAGFLDISACAYVTVRDGFFTGHKIYDTIGSAGTRVSMGSYDLNVNRASDVSFLNCRQDAIMDRTKWGLIGTNFCKRLTLDGCVFSRFDAHMGVTDCVIRSSVLGWQCLNAIGHGTLLVEDTDAYGGSFINLRSDYGSTWDGELIIRNCVWHPAGIHAAILSGFNNGGHDFGYVCKMPESVVIDGLRIADASLPDGYQGATVFNRYDDAPGLEKPYPYLPTKRLTMRNVVSDRGCPVRIRADDALPPVLDVQVLP